jgi:hypothetical protein
MPKLLLVFSLNYFSPSFAQIEFPSMTQKKMPAKLMKCAEISKASEWRREKLHSQRNRFANLEVSSCSPPTTTLQRFLLFRKLRTKKNLEKDFIVAAAACLAKLQFI